MAGIPAYEEAETIASVARAGRQHADRVVVVDDGSTDATAARAAAAGALVVRHSRNHGYGAALQTIFDQAARLDADHLVVLDGDGQHDATDIPKLIAAQRGADLDIVIGSRFQGVDQGDLPLYRRCGLAVINQLVSFGLLLLGAEFFVRDTQSGFRAYNRRAIRSLAGEASISDGMGASIDVLVHGCRRGFEIAEVGTRIRYDEGSTSTHHPVRHGAELLEHLLQMFLTSPRLPIVAWWRELERLVDATIDPRRGWYRTHPRRSGR